MQESVLAGRLGPLARRSYLAELNAAFGPIFRAFQDTNVVVDYTAAGATEAYRLHYLVHYAYTAYRAAALLPDAVFQRMATRGIRYCALAAGPVPEVIGLVEAAAERNVREGAIELVGYDIAPEAWRASAERTVEVARDLAPGIRIETRFEHADLRADHLPAVVESDVISIQNCMNEFCRGGRISGAILDSLEGIAAGGGFFASDFTRYGPTRRAMEALEAELRTRRFRARTCFDANHTEETPFRNPPRDTLFHFYRVRREAEDLPWERDYPTKRNPNCSWSVWERY